MLGVGQKFPVFHLKATVSTDLSNAFQDIAQNSYPGKWLVIFFWPKDFTFVCPTEIIEFDHCCKDFTDANSQVLGCSIDSEFVHLAWREQHPGLKKLSFPMLSDIKRELTTQLGILDPVEGVAQRVVYLVDPEGIIRFVYATDLKVGRNIKEILRVLAALQTDELCPCNWQKGEDTISV
ncbi:MAG: peroxiredoxin [Gammaproteobacteria bacterium]|jgi:peroxiredoxin (alkyl hydroperoxide reductase subunit C)